jgi:hypothetical protein
MDGFGNEPMDQPSMMRNGASRTIEARSRCKEQEDIAFIEKHSRNS